MTNGPPPRRLRLVLLCSDKPHNGYLAALLTDQFDLRAIVVEPSSAQLRRRRRQRRYGDYLAGLYHQWRRRLNGYAAHRRRCFANRPAPRPKQSPPLRYKVNWINESKTAETLELVQPDAVVVISTSIIAPRILALCNGPVLTSTAVSCPIIKATIATFSPFTTGPSTASEARSILSAGASTRGISSRWSGLLFRVMIRPNRCIAADRCWRSTGL